MADKIVSWGGIDSKGTTGMGVTGSLAVSGSATITNGATVYNNITINSSNVAALDLYDSLQNYNWRIFNNGTNFYIRDNGGNAAFSITTNRDVTIGTGVASARLHVKGSGTTSSTTALLVQNSNASASFTVRDDRSAIFAKELYIDGDLGDGTGSIFLKNSAGDYSNRIGTNGYNTFISTRGTANEIQFLFGIGSGKTLNFSGGSSNIAITSAGASFGFNGVNSIYHGSDQISIESQNYNGGEGVIITRGRSTNLTDPIVTFKYGTAEKVRINNSGNVGIGISNPTASLHISGSSGSVLLEVDSNSQQNILYVSGSGRVGMGTNAPTYQVHISGSGSNSKLYVDNGFDGNYYNKVLIGGGYIQFGRESDNFGGLSIFGNSNAPSMGARNSFRFTIDGSRGFSLAETTSMTIYGAGATSSTTALLVQNGNTTNMLSLTDNGALTLNTFQTSSTAFTINRTNSSMGSSFNAATMGTLVSINDTVGNSNGAKTTVYINSSAASVNNAVEIYGGVGIGYAPYGTNFYVGYNTAIYNTTRIQTATAFPLTSRDSRGLIDTTAGGGISFWGDASGQGTGNSAYAGIRGLKANSTYINPLGNLAFYVQTGSSSHVIDETTFREVARFNESGSFGIGTSNPTASLHISGASSNVLLEIDSPAVNNILYVSGSGTIGIGKPTAYALEVATTSSLLVSATNYLFPAYGTASAAISITPNIYAPLGNRSYYSMYVGNPGVTFSGSFGNYDFRSIYTAGKIDAVGGINAGDSRFYATSNAVSFEGYNPYDGNTGENYGGITFTQRQRIAAGDESGIGAQHINGPRLFIYHKYNSSSTKIIFSLAGSIRSTYFGNGNLSIGNGETDMSARLGVKGSGTTSSTTALLVQNANATASLSVKDDGTTAVLSSNERPFTVSHTNGSSALGIVVGNGSALSAGFAALRLNDTTNVFTFGGSRTITAYPLTIGGPTDTFYIRGGGGGSDVAAPSVALTDNTYNAGGYTVTSGTQTTVQIGGIGTLSNAIWKPASGNATYNLLAVAPNMSGSGTYSGTIRGIYYNPTVDSTTYGAHRAIETTAGDVVLSGGRVTISGSASTSSAALSIYKSGSTVLDIQGSSGQLFSVTDSLSGSLFSVNTVAGLPVIEAFSNNVVNIGKYGSYGLVVSGSAVTVATGSSAPTGTAAEGTFKFAVVGGLYYIYVYLGGAWRSGSLS